MRLRLVALFSLVFVPIVACAVLYGPGVVTAAWCEAPVALGWSASRPIWLLHPRWGQQYRATRSWSERQRQSRRHGDPALQHKVHPHGLSLVLRDGLAPHDDHPMSLILCSRLGPDSLELFIRNPRDASLDDLVAQVLFASPHDPLVRADWLTFYWGRWNGRIVNRLQAAEQAVASPPSSNPSQVENVPESAERWRLLVDAALILSANLSEPSWRHGVLLWSNAGVPDMRIWQPVQLKPLDAPSRESYVAVIEDFLRAGPGDLAMPFQQRGAEAWRQLGLDENAAAFASTNDFGASSWIVGWHCSLHLEVMQTFADTAFLEEGFDRAAAWVELAAKLANHLAESVRSPAIYNYIERKRVDLSAIAQSLQLAPDCPPQVAARMLQVRSSLGPAPARVLAAPSRFLLPAIYLDNLARAFFSIGVVTWTAAAISWLCLRYWCKQPSRDWELNTTYRSLFVAVLAIMLTLSACGLLETSNYLGEDSAVVAYGIAGIIFTITMLMGAWWLVAGELARDGDASRFRFRRRMYGLLGCAVVAVVSRWLLSIGATDGHISDSFQQFQRWSFDPSHERLPRYLRVVLGVAFPVLLIVYCILRGKRWQRSPQCRPLFHPVVIAIAGIVLGNWLLFGPFGECIDRGRSSAPSHATEWSPTVVAADTFANVLNDHFYLSRQIPTRVSLFGRGWNLLTATLAVRVTNLGFWLVAACAALWSLAAARHVRASRLHDAKDSEPQDGHGSIGPICAIGFSRSCFWLGFAALAVYAWCTLALGYCVSHVLGS